MLSSLSVWGALLWEELAPYFLLLFWVGVYSAVGTEREVDGPALSNESWSIAGTVVISFSGKLSLGAISIDASLTTISAWALCFPFPFLLRDGEGSDYGQDRVYSLEGVINPLLESVTIDALPQAERWGVFRLLFPLEVTSEGSLEAEGRGPRKSKACNWIASGAEDSCSCLSQSLSSKYLNSWIIVPTWGTLIQAHLGPDERYYQVMNDSHFFWSES